MSASGFGRVRSVATAILASGFVVFLSSPHSHAADIERGRYLVTVGLCTDCHTPGYLLGSPDNARYLGGSDVGFEVPGEGVYFARNLTPDKETGIGEWSAEEIVRAIRTGERPDGRLLSTIMPWEAFASLTDDDAMAIASYLKSLEPVNNAVPGPFGPGETVTGYVFRILPPGTVAAQAAGTTHE